MKGSSISVRIADFLKEFPPFQYLDIEELRELANHGKVKFHEDGEIVFSKGQPRNQWLYVIQEGNVKVIDETEKGEVLIDLRGAGDMLGLQGIRSDEPYLHSGRTETETILYLLPRTMVVELAEKSSQARRYLAAYFSLSPSYHWGGFNHEEDISGGKQELVTLRKGGLWEVEPPHQAACQALVTVMGDTTVRDVALRLQSKRVECVVVVDEAGRPTGKLTDAHLRARIIKGSIQPNAPVRDLMSRSLVAVSREENTGDLLIKLTRSGKNFLVVTEDGTLQSKAVGLISERNLFLQYGRFPSVIGEAIASAPDISSLRSLRDRLESLILEFLESRRSLIWLMEMVGVLNRKLTQRIIELGIERMEQEGDGPPPVEFSWLMMGSGGRDELLIRSAVYHALVYADPDPGELDATRQYFGKLAHHVAMGHRHCGFLESPQNVLAHLPEWHLSLSEMKAKFSHYIREPVASHVYSARDAFDFKPVREGCPLADELSCHISEELEANPAFIRYMASDSLLNQPPRTLFSGYVVDQEGIHRENLAIKSHALLPLVDVARVLTLAAGSQQPTATYKRFNEAAQRARLGTEAGNLLNEASEGFLVAQFARISQGLKLGTDGAVIAPSELEPETRRLLITTFRTILGLLEATSQQFELETVDW